MRRRAAAASDAPCEPDAEPDAPDHACPTTGGGGGGGGTNASASGGAAASSAAIRRKLGRALGDAAMQRAASDEYHSGVPSGNEGRAFSWTTAWTILAGLEAYSWNAAW